VWGPETCPADLIMIEYQPRRLDVRLPEARFLCTVDVNKYPADRLADGKTNRRIVNHLVPSLPDSATTTLYADVLLAPALYP